MDLIFTYGATNEARRGNKNSTRAIVDDIVERHYPEVNPRDLFEEFKERVMKGTSPIDGELQYHLDTIMYNYFTNQCRNSFDEKRKAIAEREKIRRSHAASLGVPLEDSPEPSEEEEKEIIQKLEEEARAQKIKAAEELKREAKSTIRSNMLLMRIMPNGKMLKDCLGRELGEMALDHDREAAFCRAIRARVGDDNLVGQKITEAEARKVEAEVDQQTD